MSECVCVCVCGRPKSRHAHPLHGGATYLPSRPLYIASSIHNYSQARQYHSPRCYLQHTSFRLMSQFAVLTASFCESLCGSKERGDTRPAPNLPLWTWSSMQTRHACQGNDALQSHAP